MILENDFIDNIESRVKEKLWWEVEIDRMKGPSILDPFYRSMVWGRYETQCIGLAVNGWSVRVFWDKK